MIVISYFGGGLVVMMGMCCGGCVVWLRDKKSEEKNKFWTCAWGKGYSYATRVKVWELTGKQMVPTEKVYLLLL